MSLSKKILKYLNRKESKSTDKDRSRYRNDICNHWDLDYMSIDEIDEILSENDPVTTIPKKKKKIKSNAYRTSTSYK